MQNSKKEWDGIMRHITSLTIKYLQAQIAAGVDAVQVFDSWAGMLSKTEYSEYAGAYTKKVFDGLPGGVPKIHFCAKSSGLLEELSRSGCDVLSIDSGTSIRDAFERTGGRLVLQGNLSPEIAARGGRKLDDAVAGILSSISNRRAFIFNLGHGVLKGTPPNNLKKIVRIVHEF